jgi:hypothetical protein
MKLIILTLLPLALGAVATAVAEPAPDAAIDILEKRACRSNCPGGHARGPAPCRGCAVDAPCHFRVSCKNGIDVSHDHELRGSFSPTIY